ncbi:methylated-DNA--[protein]-cysteine S-methyltransferase [Zobellia barbeyronii]|uniref:Methylated-DNA--protein-cysteine methyltransferase n=1 Tax=Zobellia barbeyronii TaxID=2748009 RepID=A0ABS5WBU6_9FLAO|nr:methylated-DNA--[protein]-cysteine S-methyltransferase [Zobellia barbeyronii]MBT2160436.1 methylated-DNA--[protein]-cysteine S-methyltransferase [Zobellia barbeyronii]
METAFIHTPLGVAKLIGDSNGLSEIKVTDAEETITTKIPQNLKIAAEQLQQYFAGTRNNFDFNLNPKGTDFQKRVWEALLLIPYGKTVSYMDLSKTLGDVKAIRAVAAANGKNPLWIVVPCHRVIGSDGSLTGYAGGLHRKKWLLDHENPVKQQSLF